MAKQGYRRIDIGKDEIIPIAEKMRKEGIMLVMIHGYLEDDGQPVISYDYEIGDSIESYNVTGEKNLPSIASIYDEAARWPELELFELIGINFEGLDTSKRLFLPETMIDGKGQIFVTPMEELRKNVTYLKED